MNDDCPPVSRIAYFKKKKKNYNSFMNWVNSNDENYY